MLFLMSLSLSIRINVHVWTLSIFAPACLIVIEYHQGAYVASHETTITKKKSH